jgi:hypothetical protein
MKQLHVIGTVNVRFGDMSVNETIRPGFIEECRRAARWCEDSQERFLQDLRGCESDIATSIFGKEARWRGEVFECISEEWELFISADLTKAKIAYADYILKSRQDMI